MIAIQGNILFSVASMLAKSLIFFFAFGQYFNAGLLQSLGYVICLELISTPAKLQLMAMSNNINTTEKEPKIALLLFMMWFVVVLCSIK